MAKKRFTDNFDHLFGDPLEDNRPEEQVDAPGIKQQSGSDAAEDDKKKPSGKDFTDSLESFLSDTFEASFERQLADSQKSGSTPDSRPRKPKRRRSSLDMLIRSTVEPSKIEIDEQARRRRITLTFEPKKLEKLKHIAQVERAMLKDIINEIVSDYIKKYEKGKGESNS